MLYPSHVSQISGDEDDADGDDTVEGGDANNAAESDDNDEGADAEVCDAVC